MIHSSEPLRILGDPPSASEFRHLVDAGRPVLFPIVSRGVV